MDKCELGDLVKILNAGHDIHCIGKILSVVKITPHSDYQIIWVEGSQSSWAFPDKQFVEWISRPCRDNHLPDTRDYLEAITEERE